MEDIILLLKDYQVFGNTAWGYTTTLLVFIVSMVVLKFFQVIILVRLKKLAKKTETQADDMLIALFENIKPPFYFLFSLFLALRYLNLSPLANKVFFVVLVLVIVYEIVRAFQKLLDFYIASHLDKSEDGDVKQTRSMIRLLRAFVVFAIWIVAGLIILSNLGVNISSLVASLGIGGIAIALALQNVLGDLFSSFSLYIDKPFIVGDYIKIGQESGTVEKIGLKTTRIRTLLGEELVVSNKELTTARVQNFKKMEKRREAFSLGVTYETSKEKLEKIPGMVENVVSGAEGAEFDRCHFSLYGDFSLNFDIVYFIDSPEYAAYMDIKQKINLGIFDAFNKEGIEFAYPTQLIYTKKG